MACRFATTHADCSRPCPCARAYAASVCACAIDCAVPRHSADAYPAHAADGNDDACAGWLWPHRSVRLYLTSGLVARYLIAPSSSSSKWVKGGFQAKMDRKEAVRVLGLREASVTRTRIKEAHRRMMIANHPDRGGSPYLASSTFLR